MGSDPHEPREGEEDVLPYRWIRNQLTHCQSAKSVVKPREMMFRPKKKRKTGEAGAGEAAAGLQAGEVITQCSATEVDVWH